MRSTPFLVFTSLAILAGCNSEPEVGGTGTPDLPAAPVADTAEATMRHIMDGVRDGKPIVAWNALPESYQADVNELVRTFATNMDAETWKQMTGLVNSVHQLLQDKQEFIFNHPAIAEGENADSSKQGIVQMTELLKTILDSAGDLEKLKTFDGAEFMKTTGAQVVTKLDALSKLAPEGGPGGSVKLSMLNDVKIETVESSDSTATLKMISPDGDEELQEFVKSQGKWLPKDMVEEWDQKMAEAREGLAALPEQSQQMKMQVTMVGGMVTGMLSPLQSAETQDQFNAAVENVIGSAGMMFGGMAGPPPGAFGSEGDGPPPGAFGSEGDGPPPGAFGSDADGPPRFDSPGDDPKGAFPDKPNEENTEGPAPRNN